MRRLSWRYPCPREHGLNVLGCGASGFLLDAAMPADLATVVRILVRHDVLLDPTVFGEMIGRSRGARQNDRARCPRSFEPGCRRDLIFIEETLKSHLSHVRGKLALRDRVKVVVDCDAGAVALPTVDTLRTRR